MMSSNVFCVRRHIIEGVSVVVIMSMTSVKTNRFSDESSLERARWSQACSTCSALSRSRPSFSTAR